MSQSRSSSNQGTVVIRMTTGVFYRLILSTLGVIALVAVFWAGLKLGGGRAASPAPQPVYYPQQAAVAQPALPQQPPAQAQPFDELRTPPQVSAADQSIPGPSSPPAGSEIPIGDNPRLALPDLAASNYVLDYGDTPVADGPVTKEVLIHNTGVKDLVISDVQTTCSCTEAVAEEQTLPPGGETVLRVTHDPQTMLNHGSTNIAHQVLIGSNDPAAPWVEINMSGTVTQ